MIKRYFRHVSMICQVLFSHIVNQRELLCRKLTKRPLLGFYHNQNHVSQISRLTYFCQYIRKCRNYPMFKVHLTVPFSFVPQQSVCHFKKKTPQQHFIFGRFTFLKKITYTGAQYVLYHTV
jgi:hypothetical protein